jgi:uncharacterized protein YktB (UPF0637 family)
MVLSGILPYHIESKKKCELLCGRNIKAKSPKGESHEKYQQKIDAAFIEVVFIFQSWKVQFVSLISFE